MFQGCGTALVTPFRRDLSLDEDGLRRLVRRQIDAGIAFLVPCGSTGENPTLRREEHLRVIQITVEEARGKVPVLGGAGGNNTADVVELARAVEQLGVDGILSVTPFYNKPTSDGLYQHFRMISDAVRVPIVVYNVPGRTGQNVEPATMLRLSEIENVWGVKESSGNLVQIATLCARSRLAVLSGDDPMTLGIIAHGGRGLISVISNVDPVRTVRMVNAALAGDYATARELFRELLALMEVCFVESNPIPAKAALAMMALIEPALRPPLAPPQTSTITKVEQVLRTLELLEPAHARL
ncbi:MAG TPA: 4-hydroxy-tetrahydrodipicolinate synthase [Bryobacteraceae bacterium]|nr:4-hydroxy-tetrahydrodipicolinate synthase [Bryobacteraceae bacterium]